MKRSASGSPINRKLMFDPNIKLEQAESKLTSLLKEAADKQAFSDPDVKIRYAGGWVRDKIIGKPSHDIDIAISTISGHEFALQFVAYLEQNHTDLKTGTITKILANPEKSKHLDTATSKFLGLELDFVQLRTEKYATPDSRTPSFVGVGTLEEDAARRDCTMNALYYNVHTQTVEDPTGQGLDDLAKGLIRTPLEPRQTFLDDPLRILRCIRFASQFDFEIDEPTLAQMKEDEVRQALKNKVVKERVGIEVLKMMKGLDPEKAIRAMYTQGLYHIVFQDLDAYEEPEDFDFAIIKTAIASLQSKALMKFLQEYMDGRLWMIVSLLPYRHHVRPVPKRPDMNEPIAVLMVRDSLKLTNVLELLVRNVFPPRDTDATATSSPRDLCRLVRRLGKDWKLILFVSHTSNSIPVADTIALMTSIHEANLDTAWSFKSYIDGKKIRSLLSEVNVDIRVMKELVEQAIEQRVENPEITESEGLDKLRQYLTLREPNQEGW